MEPKSYVRQIQSFDTISTTISIEHNVYAYNQFLND